MTEVITATGFESAFIKSWTGWDQQDTATFTFYGCRLTDVFDLDTSKTYFVNICLEEGLIEVFADDAKGDAEPLVKRNIKLTLV